MLKYNVFIKKDTDETLLEVLQKYQKKINKLQDKYPRFLWYVEILDNRTNKIYHILSSRAITTNKITDTITVDGVKLIGFERTKVDVEPKSSRTLVYKIKI